METSIIAKLKAFISTVAFKIIVSAVAGVLVGGGIVGVVAIALPNGTTEETHTHTEVIDEAIPATCQSIGLTEGKHCSECDEVIVRQNVIPAIEHTEAVDKAIDATFSTAGLTEGKHCSVCGKILVAQNEIAKLEHTYDSDIDASCNLCEAMRPVACNHPTTETIPKKEPTCTEIGSTVGVKCSVCDTIITYPSVIEANGHKYDNDDDSSCNTCSNTREILHSIGLTYSLNDDGVSYSVSGIGTCIDTDIVIPSSWNGYPLTGIDFGGFEDCTSMTSITIPDSVKCITSDSWGSVGYSNLTAVYITDLKAWCEISFEDSPIPLFANPLYYAGNLYLNGELVIDLTIANDITSIGSYAFAGCTSLTEITIPDSVTSIGGYAFYNCTGLTSITIPDSVTSIDRYAFYNCTGLTEVAIPDSVTSIGQSAFGGCSSLESITIPFVGATKDGTSNTHFGYIFGALSYSSNDYFVPTSLKTVVITGGTSIGYDAFSNCTSLTEITIPDSVTRIGEYAFWYCTSLTSITIPDSVTSIGYYAFYNCRSLASITFEGTMAQWKAISKSSSWIYNVPANKVVCSDGTLNI